MALSAEGKRAIRRAVCHSAQADSIIAKIDSPGTLTFQDLRVLRIAIPSSSVVAELSAKVSSPSAVSTLLGRTLGHVATSTVIGAGLATEIGS